MIYFVDTETFGFTGPPVLIQYQIDYNKPILFECFCETIDSNLSLLESIAENGIIGFNLTFDWFMLQKWYTMMLLMKEVLGGNIYPMNHIDTLAQVEPEARFGPCLKPSKACDLMLWARKHTYQSTMQRKDIKIRRIPSVLAFDVKAHLEKTVPIPDICFAKSTKPRWSQRVSLKEGVEDYSFCDIVLSFDPSSSLKAIVFDSGIRIKRFSYEDVKAPKPDECPHAPWALSISEPPYYTTKKSRTWPALVDEHIVHWRLPEPRQYAIEDIEDTVSVYDLFNRPELGDVDSTLACMVGSQRWHGYPVDVDSAEELHKELAAVAKSAPTTPAGVKRYLEQYLSDSERSILVREIDGGINTRLPTLELLLTYKVDCDCPTVETQESLDDGLSFGGTTTLVKKKQHIPDCKESKPHPVVEPVKKVIKAREAMNFRSLLTKLIQAGRFHAVVAVIGSLSGRVSGTSIDDTGQSVSNINALGIPSDKRIRALFPFADVGQSFSSGDFDAFEVAISDAAWGDEELRRQLLSCNLCGYTHTPDEYRTVKACPSCHKSYGFCSGCEKLAIVYDSRTDCCGVECDSFEGTFRKIHALFAMELFPHTSYNDILNSRYTDHDMYDQGKRAFFGGLLYGGDAGTINRRIGVPLEDAERGRENFFRRFKQIQKTQERIYDSFCSMRQPEKYGKVTWKEPEDVVVSLLGFERQFSIENAIAKALYAMANDPPEEWNSHVIKVTRREEKGPQKPINAAQSAIFGAAFQLQAGIYRAALNHEIQSTGADLIKMLQCDIWKLQPAGVSDWIVSPLSVHDEIDTPIKRGRESDVKDIVDSFVERLKSKIPLLKIEWKEELANWAQK